MKKSLVLSVSLMPGCYRHLQISERATLFELSSAILSSFDFYDDHLHSFFMSNRAWDRNSQFACPDSDLDDVCGCSDEVTLEMFQLCKGCKFLYLFDYGDNWQFQIKVMRVIDEQTKVPFVLKSVGEVFQYGCDEDDQDDENEDF